MMVPLLIFFIGLVGTLALAPLFGLVAGQGQSGRRIGFITLMILVGYLGGGTVLWSFVPPEWQLSFWETLAASVNAKTYGHPVEHYAESILVLMLGACVGGAIVSGALAVAAARALRRMSGLRA
jgi:hypothetical protein